MKRIILAPLAALPLLALAGCGPEPDYANAHQTVVVHRVVEQPAAVVYPDATYVDPDGTYVAHPAVVTHDWHKDYYYDHNRDFDDGVCRTRNC